MHDVLSDVTVLQPSLLLLLQDDLRGRNLPDSGERAYALSKSYLLMANTRELARRLEGTGVDVIAGGLVFTGSERGRPAVSSLLHWAAVSSHCAGTRCRY